MRLSHFEALAPICPRCRLKSAQAHPLVVATVEQQLQEQVIEGILHCSNPACQLEYPIIDGIPIIVPNVRQYLADNLFYLTLRSDLSPVMASMLGDAAGPGTPFDSNRQYLSTYTWDAYGKYDPAEPESQQGVSPGAVKRCLSAGMELLPRIPEGPAIDLGCAVGGATFELALHTNGLVIGIDKNFSLLQLAQRVLREGTVSYPRRRIGIVYDQREFPVPVTDAERVDFWACDALELPFADATFGLAVGLQLVDSVNSPTALLEETARSLRSSGAMIMATPYDWSPAVTPLESWIGGHSQRGSNAGAAEPLLRSLLTPEAHPQSVKGMQLTNEITNFPWHTRIHDRSIMQYRAHLVTALSVETDA
ncbi:class I SAM-dependent methyltransferase [endosymbiont of Ridgeia piscesae]|uniref:Methyltransferase domain n=1 Tax=endosymbiont of Ridgeia piscesae TaxID=54398 RepID=A0A0T5Z0T5_9GAMM|nr:methyltransferase domain-containing protein [endosymbiont of Ridgeia piscesae]KRT56427.1 Methyltransferase domain [endosymbiont of Ridgeia piscesae]KRT57419.1 Methyltransferase domain-containing protein [endosymbiont of Ridgeia piscesae]